MAFTIEGLAQELGIPVETLAAKGDVVARYNGYLSEADGKYRDANEKLEQAKREQAAIDAEIQKFGVTETTLAEYKTANAALTAALEEVQKSGFKVNMPNLPTNKTDPVDPNKAMQDKYDNAFRYMGAAMRVQSKYQSVFGKPFADDPTKLVDEALANRMSVEDYAERKYKFTEESARIQKEVTTKREAEVAAAAVKKYQEDNPQRSPLDQRGVASRHPQIYKPRDAADAKTFANLPEKSRLAASVARGRAMAESLRDAS